MENLLSLLKPKHATCVLHRDLTLRQAIEKIKASGLTAVPVIDDEGKYCGTVSEGDFLNVVIHEDQPKQWEKTKLISILREGYNPPVNIMASMDDLLMSAMEQNFVPVVDDRGAFIGIVTRRDIIRHFVEERNAEAAKQARLSRSGNDQAAALYSCR